MKVLCSASESRSRQRPFHLRTAGRRRFLSRRKPEWTVHSYSHLRPDHFDMDASSFSDIDLVMSYISSEIDAPSIVPGNKFLVSNFLQSFFTQSPVSSRSLY